MLGSAIQTALERVGSGESVESIIREKLAAAATDPFNCFISLLNERALEHARRIDRQVSQGVTPALAGVTVAVKDNILIQDTRTTCASRIMENYLAPYTATAVSHLEASGAVVIGKTNMDEFGMGSSTENSCFGYVRNPVNPQCVAGGSSGGTAAAVAAGYADIGLGSDTGGSIRLPASFCGITGLKPTYGAVSRYGLVAYASSMDQIGPMTRTITDASRIMSIISHQDPRDATSLNLNNTAADYEILPNRDIEGLEIGFIDVPDLLEPEVASAVDGVISRFKCAGASIEKIPLPFLNEILPVYYLIASAEASSNLARYDGIHYGTRKETSKSLKKLYKETRSLNFGNEVKRRIFLGTYALSRGNFESHYGAAIMARRAITHEMNTMFKHLDLVVSPTSPVRAFKPGEKSYDPLSMYQCDIFTVAANLGGYPSISVPCSVPEGALPVGIQFMTSQFGDSKLIQAAAFMEGLNL